jgi:hypothetical protein
LGRKKYCGQQTKNSSSKESIHDKKTTGVFKEDKTTDEELIRKNIITERCTLWITSIDDPKSKPEKAESLRNLMLEEDSKDLMEG